MRLPDHTAAMRREQAGCIAGVPAPDAVDAHIT
jgi:hypothetical protein